MLSPKDSPLGKQLTQYVCVRIVRLDDVNVGLFDRDWNNAVYYFMLNADEQIYMRYGGRDSDSPDSYLNLNSLELALKQGLELHRRHENGEWKAPPKPAAIYPRDMPLLVDRTFKRNACVECHLIGDFQNLQREQDGTLDKLAHLYHSPDIKTIGIQLDVPKGLVVSDVRGAVQQAGMRAGDRITALNGTPVYTFGDLQYTYDKVDRKAETLQLTVDRDAKPVALNIALPPRWWLTDLKFRQSSVEPRTYFEDRALTDVDKTARGLKAHGFASEVKYVSEFAKTMKSHELQVGDIVFGVDGVETDPIANTANLYITLHKSPGDSVTLDVWRNGQRIKTKLLTYRMSFRK